MRWSKTFIPTLKENPQDAEVVSHKLMVRAGLVRRLTAGAYTYLPIGYKVLRKVENIIREEMDKTGALELLMPALQPPELWKKTGRYDDMREVMIKYKDRHGKEVVLGPTHEEVVTDIVSKELRSYKDLPLILYQIQTKFRDEARPRFGIIRSCEFIMKDAYSFDVDAEAMEKSYKVMYDAYCRIFERCGLRYIAVEADPGLMGGRVSHEFMVPSEIGEDKIVVCDSCGYAASTEVALVSAEKEGFDKSVKMKSVEEIATRAITTAAQVSIFLKIKPSELVKTLIYNADNELVAILVRGDHDVNETKIKNCLKVKKLELAKEYEVEKVTGGPMGFSGPKGLSIKILADNAVRSMSNFVTGANKKDIHLCNVNIDRDFRVDKWIDARTIREDDKCPRCLAGISVKHAIEIGHTFKLGTKYSEQLNTVFLDEKGKERTAIMGCYGIGVTRILASLIESNYDENGIIWPVSVSPYEVVIIPVKKDNQVLYTEAENIYKTLKLSGIDVIIDDRDKSAGIKFKDADLIGFPLQVIIGEKCLGQNKIEIKGRKTGQSTLIDKDKVIEYILTRILH